MNKVIIGYYLAAEINKGVKAEKNNFWKSCLRKLNELALISGSNKKEGKHTFRYLDKNKL